MTILYNINKYLYFPETLKAFQNRRVVSPTHVRIKPINHCNHNCWYCAYRNDSLQLGDDIELIDVIPSEKMQQIVNDIIDMDVKAVTFTGGGEPLIYKGLIGYIKQLAEADVKIGVLTNGSNLKGKVADTLASYGSWVRVSIDAWDDESYMHSRGVPHGTFSKLMNNMSTFSKLDTKCVLGVSYIISADNYQHIYSICKTFCDIGVNHVKLSGVVVGNDVDKNNEYHDKISAEVASQIESAMTLDSDEFSIINHYHQLDKEFEKNYDICPYLMYLTVIGADSCVYTCQDKAYTQSGKLGDLTDQSFKDFWFSDENKNCIYTLDPSKTCKHHCITHHKNISLLEFIDNNNSHTPFV